MVLEGVREIFRSDSEEVQREWVKFTQKLDKKVEEALRYAIKKSLQELSRVSKRGGRVGGRVGGREGALQVESKLGGRQREGAREEGR